MSKMNYYVLFHVQNKTKQLLRVLQEIESFEVFYPQYEYYRRDSKTVETKPSFPGYVFVKTELDQKEFDEVLYDKNNTRGLFKQLKRENGFPALSKEEIHFFELFYDENGILKMSYGQCQNKKIKVEEGPLKGLDNFIIKYDKHNKNVVLDIHILNKKVRCGFIEK